MKISIEHEDEKFTIESPAVSINEVMQLIKQMLLGMGFHWDTVKEYFEEE